MLTLCGIASNSYDLDEIKRCWFNVDSRVLGDTATPLFIEHSVADLIITNCDFLFRGKQVFLLDMSDGSYTLPYVISADVTAEHILRLVPGVGDALHRHQSNWCVDFDTESVIVIQIRASLKISDGKVGLDRVSRVIGISPEALVHLARAGICPETIAQNILEN